MSEANTAGLSEGTKRAGDTRGRWGWVEPSVWTERMLTALEERVKGGKWFSLIDLDSQKFSGIRERLPSTAFVLSNSMFRIVISSTIASSRL